MGPVRYAARQRRREQHVAAGQHLRQKILSAAAATFVGRGEPFVRHGRTRQGQGARQAAQLRRLTAQRLRVAVIRLAIEHRLSQSHPFGKPGHGRVPALRCAAHGKRFQHGSDVVVHTALGVCPAGTDALRRLDRYARHELLPYCLQIRSGTSQQAHRVQARRQGCHADTRQSACRGLEAQKTAGGRRDAHRPRRIRTRRGIAKPGCHRDARPAGRPSDCRLRIKRIERQGIARVLAGGSAGVFGHHQRGQRSCARGCKTLHHRRRRPSPRPGMRGAATRRAFRQHKNILVCQVNAGQRQRQISTWGRRQQVSHTVPALALKRQPLRPKRLVHAELAAPQRRTQCGDGFRQASGRHARPAARRARALATDSTSRDDAAIPSAANLSATSAAVGAMTCISKNPLCIIF
ncbi:amidase domain protein [Bordetella holmesii ATCC 51541]|nr:amidase domain protein [Bordetella holmesii ATCC 51541]